jgi:hypothetical protein
MRHFLLVAGLLFMAGCAINLPPSASPDSSSNLPTPVDENTKTQVTAQRADLPNLGAAPELTNETWLNTDVPLRLADLRGKVVLLDMWTFG